MPRQEAELNSILRGGIKFGSEQVNELCQENTIQRDYSKIRWEQIGLHRCNSRLGSLKYSSYLKAKVCEISGV